MKKGIMICIGILLVLLAIYLVDTRFRYNGDTPDTESADTESADLSSSP